jgi:predicted PhzF superfamily epimerase YddE/YHI9
MNIRIHHVNAFTDRWFAGNPAAVCLLEEPRDESWMQGVAAQMNLSETAFLAEHGGGGDGGYDLRWFTPLREVNLCGHATLASAHVLWSEGCLGPGEEARFHTASGLLTARLRGDSIEMNFPALAPVPADPPPLVPVALGTAPRRCARAGDNWLLELESEAAVRAVRPDFALLRSTGASVIVTAPSTDPELDFVSRYFAPCFGVDEDPVTGSAHCSLGPYWQERLRRRRFVARQVSARGGTVTVQVEGDRVLLGGRAVTVLRGELVERTAAPVCR